MPTLEGLVFLAAGVWGLSMALLRPILIGNPVPVKFSLFCFMYGRYGTGIREEGGEVTWDRGIWDEEMTWDGETLGGE